jgi:Na+/phosphate symporter
MAIEYVDNHVKRVESEGGDLRGGIVFTSMISDLERCADHAYNIAFYYPIMNVGASKRDLVNVSQH